MTSETLPSALAAIEGTYEEHLAAGAALFEACDGICFPMDTLALAVLDRSMSQVKGFCLLVRNGGYLPAAGVLRMQLDNLIRFNGVMHEPDPHDTASRVIAGEQQDRIKGADGKPMRDRHLRQLLSEANPWIDGVYNLASGYVHLSHQHVRHLVQRCAPNAAGRRDLAIGDADDYLRDDERLDLANAFLVVSRAVLTVVSRWTERRGKYGSDSELVARFAKL